MTLKTGRGQHRKYLPHVFTEHGAFQAANILNDQRASAMSVYVIRAFVKMREDVAANAAILRRLAEIDKTLLVHDVTLREILQKLRPLLEPPPSSPKPETGFHVKEAINTPPPCYPMGLSGRRLCFQPTACFISAQGGCPGLV